MHKPGLVWKFYAFYWSLLSLRALAEIFSPDSPVHYFYQVLGAFHWSFFFIYAMGAVGTILNCVSLVPLFGFAFHKKLLSPKYWKPLFVFRAAFDVCGNYYAFVSMKSLFFTEPWLGAQVLAGALLTVIPSYGACFQYAFQWDKVFADQK